MESQAVIDSAFDPNLLELSTKSEIGTLDGPDCFLSVESPFCSL